MTTTGRQPAASPQNQQSKPPTNDVHKFARGPGDKTKDVSSLTDVLKGLNNNTTQEETEAMKKAVKEALAKAIVDLKSGDAKTKAASLNNLKLLRSEVSRLADVMGKDSDELLEAFDETIKQGKKTNGFLNVLTEQAKGKSDELKQEGVGIVKSMAKGFYNEASPFLKLGINITKGIWGYTRSLKEKASEVTDESKEALEGIQKAVAVKGEAKPNKAPKPVQKDDSKPTEDDKGGVGVIIPASADKPVAERVEFSSEPKAAPERKKPSKDKGEGPLVSNMRAVKEATDAQTDAILKLVDAVVSTSPTPTEKAAPARAKGNHRQQKKEAKKADSLSSTDIKPELVAIKEAENLQIGLLESIDKALFSPEQRPTKSEDKKAEKVKDDNSKGIESIKDQLKRLDNINESIGEMVEQGSASLEMQREALVDSNKSALQALDDERGSASKIKNPINGGDVAKKVEGEGKGLLATFLPDIVGEIIGNKLGRGKGILGGVTRMLKGMGGMITKLFKPAAWVAGFEAVTKGFSFLSKPSEMLSGISSIGGKLMGFISKPIEIFKGIASTVGKVFGSLSKPFEVVKGLFSSFGKVGELFGKSMGGLTKLLSGGKAIPVIGEVIAVVMAIWDFFDGFINADEIIDKPKEMINLWDRISAGLGSIVGGLVGIVDAITGLFGFETKFGDTVKKGIGNFLSSLPDAISKMFTSWVDQAKGTIAAFGESFMGGLKNLGKMVLRAMLSMVPGGNMIAEKLGLDKADPPASGGEQQTATATPTQSTPQPAPTTPPAKPGVDVVTAPKATTQFGDKAVKNEVEIKKVEAVKAADQQKPEVKLNTNNNVNNTVNNTYTSGPLTTRNPDDTHRRGM